MDSPSDADAAGAALRVRFFAWALGVTTTDRSLRRHERTLLARLDALLADASAHGELLPRAPAVVPQLMKILRDEHQSAGALAGHVLRDPHLVAEVIRLANSAGSGAATPVTNLPEAIHRLGTDGLRRAIARVLLKPLFDAQPGSLSARAAPRLWAHSEAKATRCMLLAADAGIDPFDGYLAGLMHNVGWTAALRALDRAATPPVEMYTEAFVAAFTGRCDGFFVALTARWQMTEALTALAASASTTDRGLADSPLPLALALHEADRSAAQQLVEDPPAL